jgi:hypothetical protein
MFGQPQAQDASSSLEDVVATAKPHLTSGELRELEKLLSEFKYMFLVVTKTMGGLTKFFTV